MVSTIGFGTTGQSARDLLGQVYEYFLGQFASAEGKRGGQFYTPASIVKTLVAILAPHQGQVPLPPLRGSASGSLCSIVQNYKSVSTRKINKLRNNPGCAVWQRNYYERVIRNEDELFRAREYIVNNPMKWELDRENPINAKNT